jgi:hypothetical protein
MGLNLGLGGGGRCLDRGHGGARDASVFKMPIFKMPIFKMPMSKMHGERARRADRNEAAALAVRGQAQADVAEKEPSAALCLA